MNSLSQTLKKLGPARLMSLAFVGAGLALFLFFASGRLSQAGMSLLYADLQPADSGAIIARLDSMKVPYKVSDDGAQIMIAQDQVGKVRMTLAADGLPGGGSVGYEIFDKQQGLGTSSFVQNINQVRALEGELQRTVNTIAQIKQSRIHLVLPKRELFSHDAQPASASVFVQVKSGQSLGKEQVLAIQHLVSASVPQLEASHVTVIDARGNLLARGSGDTADGLASQNAQEEQLAYENRLRQSVEDMLASIVGPGKVRANVSAEMDFDRVTTNSESYDPEGQVARSTQTVEEKGESSETAGQNAVSVSSNIPGQQGGAGTSSGNSNTSNRTEETVNYEIAKTVKNQVKEVARVKRVSVAVLVDGVYETPAADEAGKDKDKNAEEAKPAWRPRTDKEIEQITTLVKSAVGFDASRGDVVEVINMPFSSEELGDAGASAGGLPMGLTKGDLMSLAQTLLLGVVTLLVFLLGVKPVLSRIVSAGPVPQAGGMLALPAGVAGSAGALSAPDGQQYALENRSGGQAALAAPAEFDGGNTEIERMIDLNQVEGRVRGSSIRKIGDLVEKHPAEAATIIRSWMGQEKQS